MSEKAIGGRRGHLECCAGNLMWHVDYATPRCDPDGICSRECCQGEVRELVQGTSETQQSSSCELTCDGVWLPW